MDLLEELPERMDRVESQLLQLREEVREGFPAVRSELRGEIRDLGVSVHQDFVAFGVMMDRRFAEQLAQTRMLLEEVVRRIA